MDQKIELIMQLKDIPDNSIVRKITGEVKFKVFSSITVFTKTDDIKSQKLEAKNGSKFLVKVDGDYGINAHSGDTKFVVTDLSSDDVYRLLEKVYVDEEDWN